MINICKAIKAFLIKKPRPRFKVGQRIWFYRPNPEYNQHFSDQGTITDVCEFYWADGSSYYYYRIKEAGKRNVPEKYVFKTREEYVSHIPELNPICSL